MRSRPSYLSHLITRLHDCHELITLICTVFSRAFLASGIATVLYLHDNVLGILRAGMGNGSFGNGRISPVGLKWNDDEIDGRTRHMIDLAK